MTGHMSSPGIASFIWHGCCVVNSGADWLSLGKTIMLKAPVSSTLSPWSGPSCGRGLFSSRMITWSEIITITALSVASAAIGATLVAVVVRGLF